MQGRTPSVSTCNQKCSAVYPDVPGYVPTFQLDSFAEQLRFYLMIFNITTRHCADECIITKKSHFKTKIYYSTWYTSNSCQGIYYS